MTSPELPTGAHQPRYRCDACGNLTRFDVVSTVTTRAFHHFDLGGELSIEEPEILAAEVQSVSCRWCDGGGQIVELPAPPPAGT